MLAAAVSVASLHRSHGETAWRWLGALFISVALLSVWNLLWRGMAPPRNVGLGAGRTYYGRGFGGFNRGTAVRPTPFCCRLARSAYWRGRAIMLGSFRLRPRLAAQVDVGALSDHTGSRNPVESRPPTSLQQRRISVPGSGNILLALFDPLAGTDINWKDVPLESIGSVVWSFGFPRVAIVTAACAFVLVGSWLRRLGQESEAMAEASRRRGLIFGSVLGAILGLGSPVVNFVSQSPDTYWRARIRPGCHALCRGVHCGLPGATPRRTLRRQYSRFLLNSRNRLVF